MTSLQKGLASSQDGRPVRRFRPYKGQRLPGELWSATDGRLVEFESWLERDHLMLLDFDPASSVTYTRTRTESTCAYWDGAVRLPLSWTSEAGHRRPGDVARHPT
jgi:hypothetical protein